MLYFWTSTCTGCMDAFAGLNGIQDLTGAEHLQIVAINQKEARKRFKDIATALANTSLMLTRDNNSKIGRRFGVTHKPYFVVIGADGKIAARVKPD